MTPITDRRVEKKDNRTKNSRRKDTSMYVLLGAPNMGVAGPLDRGQGATKSTKNSPLKTRLISRGDHTWPSSRLQDPV